MKRENIIQLMGLLGIQNVKPRQTWVMGSCPFSAVYHESGTDHNPSFGIKVDDPSHYNCFSCHKRGPLMMLPSTLERVYNKDFGKARAFVLLNEVMSSGDYEKVKAKPEDLMGIPDRILDKFDPCPPILYQKRGISTSMARKAELLYDVNERRMVFPIRDEKGRLVGIRGRAMYECDTGKYRTYTELHPGKQDPKLYGVWYGQHIPLAPGRAIVLVEGEINRLCILQTKKVHNCWAGMGSELSRLQITTLQNAGFPLVHFFDNDKAGFSTSENVFRNLKGLVPQYRVTKYFGYNDAADLWKAKKLEQALQSIRRL